MRQVNEEIKELAEKIVENCNYSFLTKEDIENNFRDRGFLVNENVMIGYTSYMEYDSNTQKGIISFTKEESLKTQEKILLINFIAFSLNSDNSFKMYYKDIPNKKRIKNISKYLLDASAEKKFSIENNVSNYENIQEGRKVL